MIPGDLDQVDAAWLGEVLGREVRAARRLDAPLGVAVTSHVGRFALDADLPGPVVVKLARAEHPHVQMYATEVRTYHELTGLPLPRCYHAEAGADGFALVLEDVAGAHRIGGAGEVDARRLIAAVADWHVRHADLDWPVKRLPAGGDHRQRVADGWARLDRSRFAVSADVERAAERLVAGLPAAMDALAAANPALLHSDLHTENVLFTADRVVVIDWQNTARGPAAIDVAGALTCVAPAVLDAHGADLIEAYERVAGPVDHEALRGAVGYVAGAIAWLADRVDESERAWPVIAGHWGSLAATIRLVWG